MAASEEQAREVVDALEADALLPRRTVGAEVEPLGTCGDVMVLTTESEEGDALTAWVAVDDPHHVLKLEVTEGKEPGILTFSGFDEKPDVKPPADDEVVDLTQAG